MLLGRKVCGIHLWNIEVSYTILEAEIPKSPSLAVGYFWINLVVRWMCKSIVSLNQNNCLKTDSLTHHCLVQWKTAMECRAEVAKATTESPAIISNTCILWHSCRWYWHLYTVRLTKMVVTISVRLAKGSVMLVDRSLLLSVMLRPLYEFQTPICIQESR